MACSGEKEEGKVEEIKDVITEEKEETPDEKTPTEEVEEDEVIEEEPNTTLSTTTGLKLSEGFESNPFSVMVENSPAARPHTGLVDADVVYEFEVEGRITRFLALFHDNIPKKVGPVRSSRHYFIPVAESYQVPYIHFGGSPYAYKDLKNVSIPSYDGITEGQYFRRDTRRKAPHNAYLHTDKLKDYNGEVKSNFTFNKEEKEIGQIKTVSYRYSNINEIEYAFNENTKLYTRFLEGAKHIDRETNKSIKARNVIFLTAKHQPIKGDTSGRIDVSTKGSGELTLFTNGKKIEGKWRYDKGTFHYYDSNSNVLKLNPGSTWIQVIRDRTSIITN